MAVVDALRVDVAVLLGVVLVGRSLFGLRRMIASGRRGRRRLSVFKVRVVVVLRGHVVLDLVVRLRVRLVRAKHVLERHHKKWASDRCVSGESRVKDIIHVGEAG